MLAQLIPVSGGLAAFQLSSSATKRSRYRGSFVNQNARPSANQC
jgi:hypothetical protein